MSESSPSSPSLYQEFLAERDEVMRHKWLLSEQAGSDVGLETALVDWVLNCRTEWKKDFLKRQKQG
ncbi:MAG: DUF4032 domain-containing protein [Verrucomicrobiales bacterium]|jgi:hypothetical protein|nr:DUF4032 domain-containing protein [bacterium]MDF2375999.1 DUF4032 domain-containing protein [Verrucomicrobiales bacterium]